MAGRDLVERIFRKLIPAFRFIPRSETPKYLESLGINIEGRTCFKCGARLTVDTIGVIFNDGKRVEMACNSCLEKHSVFGLYREFAEKIGH